MLTNARGWFQRFTIGLVVAAGICLVGGLLMVMQAQTGGRDEQPAAQAARAPKVLFLGDSLTAGLYAVTPEDSFRALVAKQLDVSPVLVSSSGGRTRDFLPSARAITAEAADVVVVELGTNDCSGYSSFVPVDQDVFAANLRTLAQAARAGNPACRFVSITVWQAAPARGPYDARIREVAESYGAPVVDISSIKDDPADCKPAGVATFWGVSDGWHPNNAGHAAIAALLAPVLAAVLSAPNDPR